MRVALLNTKATARSDYLLECFALGLKVHGDEPVPVRDRDDLAALDRADVGVQVCFPNRHHDGNPLAVFRLEAYDRLRSAGKRVLTIDTGFVAGQPEAELVYGFKVDHVPGYRAFDSRIYYSVGYDGLKNHGFYGLTGTPSDSRWKQTGQRLKPWRAAGSHILLIGQPRHGQSTQHLDVHQWVGQALQAIRAVTPRPVVYRPHPRIATLRTNRGRLQRDRAAVLEAAGKAGAGLKFSNNTHLVHDLKGAWAVVVLTSNAAVEAAIHGIPVISCDRGCMAWDVSSHSLSHVLNPKTPDRTAWTSRLAYAQWTAAEMRTGDCWNHLRPHAEAKPCSS